MKLTRALSILILFIAGLISGCKKETDNSDGQTAQGNHVTINTTVSGIVLDEYNLPLPGVNVSGYGKTTATNASGTFVLQNFSVDKERCDIKFSKAGYFIHTRSIIAAAGKVNYVKVIMTGNTSVQSLASSAGGTVNTTDGSYVQFPANCFKSANGALYNGSVNIAIKHFSPSDAGYSFLTPGDFTGTDKTDQKVFIKSFGISAVTLAGNGSNLQIADGSSAIIGFAISSSQLINAPSTIPLWYFDENTSKWIEEGSATKTGNIYIGIVHHFSWWCSGYALPRATIQGIVKDCNGTALSNVIVSVDGDLNLMTNQNGEFQTWVPAGFIFPAQVLTTYNSFLSLGSQLVNIPVLTGNQNYILPDLIVSCPAELKGSIVLCNNAATGGLINASWGPGQYWFQFTTNGNFNLLCAANSNINVNAISINTSTSYFISTHYSTLAAGSVNNVGNILLCDTIASANWIRMTDCFLMNDTIIEMMPPITNAASRLLTNTNGDTIGISAFYNYNNGINSIHMITQGGDTSGTYNIQQSTFTTVLWGWVNPADSTDWLSLTAYSGTITFSVGGIGGYIEGNYSGSGIMRKTGINAPVNFSGKFKTLRNF